MDDDKIGCKVLVKHWDATYSTYESIFEKLGFKNTKVNNANYKAKPDEIHTVFNSTKHEDHSIRLYAIKDSKDRQFLISERGLIFINM